MSSELHGLFTPLEPPPGGAERFARRLGALAAAPAERRAGVPLLGTAACAALLLLAAVFALRAPESPRPQLIADTARPVDVYGAPAFDRLLGRPSVPAELAVIVDEQTAAVTQVETQNAKVRVYRIN